MYSLQGRINALRDPRPKIVCVAPLHIQPGMLILVLGLKAKFLGLGFGLGILWPCPCMLWPCNK